jgi:hypothetical protein
MFELTPEQRAEVRRTEPARAFDPETKEIYVLVPASRFDRLKDILDDVDSETMYPLLAEIAPEDWEDPLTYGNTRS